MFPHPEKKQGYMKMMSEAQYVSIPFYHFHRLQVLKLRGDKEDKSWDLEERDLVGNAGTVQETSETRPCTRDHRRYFGGERGGQRGGTVVSTNIEEFFWKEIAGMYTYDALRTTMAYPLRIGSSGYRCRPQSRSIVHGAFLVSTSTLVTCDKEEKLNALNAGLV